ncbi:MAG TPA: zf-HC2 domain-containing protein [Sphingomicrobium sp.]|nr:zf-HC2 domain-containing protein [Sphingomicrobium sp.]
MAEIIPLRGSSHEQILQLLPWYTNGTLDANERAGVEAHLADCADCRAEADGDEVLAREMASLDTNVEHGWKSISARVDGVRQGSAPVPLLRRRIPVAWMLAGQAAAVAFAVYVAVPSSQMDGTYRALGSADANEAGTVAIVFQPDASERQIRSALLRGGARIVDGPNDSGAYVLRVPQNRRPAALKRLRELPQVMLAEPIDPERQL